MRMSSLEAGSAILWVGGAPKEMRTLARLDRLGSCPGGKGSWFRALGRAAARWHSPGAAPRQTGQAQPRWHTWLWMQNLISVMLSTAEGLEVRLAVNSWDICALQGRLNQTKAPALVPASVFSCHTWNQNILLLFNPAPPLTILPILRFKGP